MSKQTPQTTVAEPQAEASGEKLNKKEIDTAKFRIPPEDIPNDLRDHISNIRGEDIAVYPAKESGSYRGPVIHADPDFIAQAVGKNEQTIIVHRRADLEMVGASLKYADQHDKLEEKNLQIHYEDTRAKAFPWNPEKDKANKEAAQHAAEKKAVTAESLLSKAEQYAVDHIKTPKQREEFIKHFAQVSQEAFGKPVEQQQQSEQPQSTLAKTAEPGIER